MPCVGLENSKFDKKTYFISDRNYSASSLDRFLEGYLAKNISHLDIAESVKKSFAEAQQKINLLNDTKNLNFLEFYSYMQDRGVDKAVFLFNSSAPISDIFLKRAAMFNFIAETSRSKLNNHDLLVASYDVARVRLDNRLEAQPNFELDNFIVIPASKTNPPFPRFESEEWTAADIITFIEDHRDFKYRPANHEEQETFDSLLRPLNDDTDL